MHLYILVYAATYHNIEVPFPDVCSLVVVPNELITMCLWFNQRHTVYVSTIFLILKQDYMFRLEVSHLQVPTTFSLTYAVAPNKQNKLYSFNTPQKINF